MSIQSKPIRLTILTVMVLTAGFVPAQTTTSRVKDIAYVDGAQENYLYGYGLVFGLQGTGDGSTGFTATSLANMLNTMGYRATPSDIKPDNVAAVFVTAKLQPFVRPGSPLDVTVMSMTSAKNLQGGYLLQTPLYGADNQVHAVAQGPISIGGFLVTGGGGGGGTATVQRNHPTVGTIPNGAIVEGEEVIHSLVEDGFLRFNLYDPDFRTAYNLKESINEALGVKAGNAINSAVVEINMAQLEGSAYSNVVDLVAMLEQLPVVTDIPARIVLNENTGTVVAGENIRIHPVAIAHGNLSIVITETQQPVVAPGIGAPAAIGSVTNTEIQADVEPGGLFFVNGATVRELVDSLNQLGVNPRDLIAIFQALKTAGALKAELVLMPS